MEFRERVLEERAQRAEACKRQAAVEEEKRLQALLRLAAMVPYADRIANIQADPLKPTKFTEVRRRDTLEKASRVASLSSPTADHV